MPFEKKTLDEMKMGNPYGHAARLAYLGREDDAMILLRDMVDRRGAWSVFIAVDPQFDPLRGREDFRALLEEIGTFGTLLPAEHGR